MTDALITEYHNHLTAACVALDGLNSPPISRVPSPATRANNRWLIDALQERMIYFGQMDPVPLSEELENVALHVRSLQPEGDEVPLPADSELRKAVYDVVVTIKRASRQPIAGGNLENFIDQVQGATDEVPTPSSLQARDPGDLAAAKKITKDLEKGLIRKDMLPARVARGRSKVCVSIVASTRAGITMCSSACN